MRNKLLLFVAILVLSAPALAQYGSAGYGNPALRISETPPFTQADIRIMDSILGLTPEQRELTDALHSEFFERYRTEATQVRLELEAIVEEAAITQRFELITDRGNSIAAAWKARREEFRSQFIEDLRLLMDQNQIQLWHKVERELRRKDQIGNGRIAGESIDLILLVDAHATGWEANPELVAELDRYAERMDRALVARERLITSERGERFYALQTEDPEGSLKLLDEALELRRDVLRVNTETLDRIRVQLEPGTHQDILMAFYRQATERAIPASPIAARIEAVRGLASLTAEQRDRLSAALKRYDDSALATRRSMFEALSQTQLTIVPEQLNQELRRRAGGEDEITHESLRQPQPLLDKALADRLERERAAWSAIKPVLTTSQLAELPKLDMQTVWFPNINWFGL